MSSIAVISAVVCISALGCSLVSLVAPQGNTRRILNTVLGAFILCAMIVPLKNAISDFNVNMDVAVPSENLTASADEAFNKAVVLETKISLENTLEAYLLNKNIAVNDVDIKLASYDNGGIYIDSISIFISKDTNNDTDKITKLTQEKFEIKPHIFVR